MTSSVSQLISKYHLPFGDYPHAEGLQQLKQESANKLVVHFLKKTSRWPRWWHQLPVYEEHPDEFQWPFKRNSFLRHFHGKTLRQFLSNIWKKTQCVLPYFKEKLSLGRVTNLEVDPLGLLITIQWKHTFALGEGSSISPRWRTEQLANGRLLPIELISIGVTHSPNISQIKELKALGAKENWLLENLEESFTLKKADPATSSMASLASEKRSSVEIKNSENLEKGVKKTSKLASTNALLSKKFSKDSAKSVGSKDFLVTKKDLDDPLCTEVMTTASIAEDSEDFSASTHPNESTKADSSSPKVSAKKPRLKTKRLPFSASLADQSTLAQLAQTRMQTHKESYLQAWASLKQSYPGLFS